VVGAEVVVVMQVVVVEIVLVRLETAIAVEVEEKDEISTPPTISLPVPLFILQYWLITDVSYRIVLCCDVLSCPMCVMRRNQSELNLSSLLAVASML